MTKNLKVSAKPVKTIFVAQLVIIPLFMLFGLALFSVGAADKEVMPYLAIFILIWETVCIALLVNAVKVLRRIKNGKIEIAEISGLVGKEESIFAAKLRELNALKKDALISDDEYRKKRAEIMQEKW